MKVLKILLSNCTFLRHSPLMAKLLTTDQILSDVLKIFSLVKHRNAAIFLVTISQIKIPTNYKDKEIDIWDNSDLIIFQSIIGYMSRYMWSILQSQEIHLFGFLRHSQIKTKLKSLISQNFWKCVKIIKHILNCYNTFWCELISQFS